MANKSLSTGTLSLRFMQNAQRAKQQKEVEVERAQVQDEAEWHVSQAVKDAWGTASSSTEVVIEQESSYLPFIFPAHSSDVNESSEGTSRPRGRRKFDKKGEVMDQQPTVIESVPAQERPAVKKLHSISSFGPGPSKKKAAAAAISAKQAIFETTGVEHDLRSRRNDDLPEASPSSLSTITKPSGFLKPAGIDSPKPKSTELSSTTGAKRDRAVVDDEKKPKKKKRKSTGATADES